MKIDSRPATKPSPQPLVPQLAQETVTSSTSQEPPAQDLPLPKASASTQAAPLGLASTRGVEARTLAVADRCWPLPQLSPLLAGMAVQSSGAALAGRLRSTTRGDVENQRYDTFVFVLELARHLQAHVQSAGAAPVAPGAATQRLVAAFRSFAPDALRAWHQGGSNCVGHCLDLVARLRSQGVPAFLVPVEHPPGTRRSIEPPFGHVAAVVPFVDGGQRGLVLCDTGANIGEPVVLLPSQPVTVPLGNTGRSWTYTLAADGQTVSCARPKPLSAGGGTETTTLHVQELLNADVLLTRTYASLNPRATLCARTADGTVTASVVVDFERQRLRFSAGQHKVQLRFGDDVEAVVTPAFARLLGRDVFELRSELKELVAASSTLNNLRLALEGGAA